MTRNTYTILNFAMLENMSFGNVVMLFLFKVLERNETCMKHTVFRLLLFRILEEREEILKHFICLALKPLILLYYTRYLKGMSSVSKLTSIISIYAYVTDSA